MLSRNSDFVTEGDDTPGWFSSLWIAYQWIVVNALLDFEVSYRFGRIGSLVAIVGIWQSTLFENSCLFVTGGTKKAYSFIEVLPGTLRFDPIKFLQLGKP